MRDVVLLECAPLRGAISTSLLGVSLVQRDAYAVRHAVFEKSSSDFAKEAFGDSQHIALIAIT